MLSDPDRVLIERLGAKNAEKNSTKRSHFVFEKGTGKLLDAQIGIKPNERCVNPSHLLAVFRHTAYTQTTVMRPL